MKISAMAAALLLSCACAQAAEYRRLDLATSHIRFTSRQMGVPVDGAFRKFDASLAFDPDAPAAAADSCASTCPASTPACGRSMKR